MEGIREEVNPEQLAHDNAQLRSRLEALEGAYDELGEANEQQHQHIEALKKEKRNLEALCQRRKADMEDMVALQDHCTSLERQLRETKAELQSSRSELRKASFQLQLRSARNASMSSRASTANSGSVSSISSQCRSRTFNTARDVLTARRNLLRKLTLSNKANDQTARQQQHASNSSRPAHEGKDEGPGDQAAVEAALKDRVQAAVLEVSARYEARIAHMQEALDEEIRRRRELQEKQQEADATATTTAVAGQSRSLDGGSGYGDDDDGRNTSAAAVNLAEELSRVASHDEDLPVGADTSVATTRRGSATEVGPSGGREPEGVSPVEAEAARREGVGATDNVQKMGEDEGEDSSQGRGQEEASDIDKNDSSKASVPSSTLSAAPAAASSGGAGGRIVLPVSATLTTELRNDLPLFPPAGEHTDSDLQQQIIMELENEVAELREELEDLIEERDSLLSDFTKVKAERTSTLEETAVLNSQITALHQRAEAMATEHRSLQRRFLVRGDQLIALRRICTQHGLGDVVRSKLAAMQQAVSRDREEKSEQLRERLYTQVDSSDKVEARRKRAATMMQQTTRTLTASSSRQGGGKTKKESPLEAARRAALARRDAKRRQGEQQQQQQQHGERAPQQQEHPPHGQPHQQQEQPGRAAPSPGTDGGRTRVVSLAHAPASRPGQQRPPPTVSSPPQSASSHAPMTTIATGHAAPGPMSTRQRLASVSTALRRASMSVSTQGKPAKPAKPRLP